MRKYFTVFFASLCTLCAYAQPDPPPPPLCTIYSIISVPRHDTTLCLNGGGLTLQGDTTNSIFSGPHVTNGVFSPTALGTFRIFYTNADTCIKPDSVDITVIAPPAPPSVISGLQTVCWGEVYTTYSIERVAGVDYNWTYQPFYLPHLAVNDTFTNVYWNYIQSYCGPATVSVSTYNACGTSAAQTINIVGQCEPEIDFTVGGPYCQTTDTFHLLTDIPGGTWGGCNVTPDGVFTPLTVGTCAASYQFSINGCNYTRYASLTVNPPATVSIIAPPTACINGGPINITGSPAGGTFTPLLTSPISLGTNTYTYSFVGAYGCSGTATANVNVQPLPTANFGHQQTNCKTLCFGDMSINANTWTWDFGDGATAPSSVSCHTYDSLGTYCVTQTATNTCGTHDTTICIVVECNAITENDAAKVLIYPNPATDMLTINTGNLQGVQVELFDISGRKLLQQKVTSSLESIDVSALTNGVYICAITANNRVVKREKICISN